MKKFAIISCSALLVSAAMAAPKAKKVPVTKKTAKAPAPEMSELEKRIKNGATTKIILTGDEVISVPPQILRVTAQSFSYQFDATGDAFGRTVLKGDAKGRASVTLIGTNGQPPVEITAPEIEVETALTEIKVYSRHLPRERGDIPYEDLSDALKAAPQSPRFTMGDITDDLSEHDFGIIIYDRRTKNLYSPQIFWQRTKRNITDADIKKWGATRIESTPE